MKDDFHNVKTVVDYDRVLTFGSVHLCSVSGVMMGPRVGW